MRRLITIAALAACAAGGSAAAQQRIHGRTLDSDGRSIAYATIIATQDERQITGTTSDLDGNFALQLPDGDYTVTARFIGYDDASREVTVAGEQIDMGDIVLAPWRQSVGEVVVTADRIRRQADRFVVEVGAADTGKDGAEVVAQSPGVWLSDSGLTINGAAATKLYVDGREIRLSGEQLTAYLRNMRSEEIARIEVIPTATADYAADAEGGIVAITLRRRHDIGVSGSASYTALIGGMLTSHRPAAAIDLCTGRWTLTAAAAATPTPRTTMLTEEQRSLPAAETPFYDSRSDAQQRDNRYTARIGAFVDIDDRHSLGMEAEYGSTRLESPSTIETAIGTTLDDLFVTGRYDCLSTSDMLSAAANYTLRIDTIGSALRIIADYTLHRSQADNLYSATTTAGTQIADTLYNNTALTRYAIFSADASLDKRYGCGIGFKAGARYTRTSLDDSSLWRGNAGGMWLPQTAYDADNDYTESVAAAYATVSGEKGRLSLSAGLRGEYTSTRKHGDFSRNYFDLFPNASVTWAFDNARRWIIAVNYSRNIERPTFARLDPARIQISEYSYMQGNADLRPTYIHRINATLIYLYRFTLTAGGNLHRDLIRELCIIPDQAPATSCIMPVNHYSENHWFVAVTLPFRIGGIANLTINAVGVNQRIRTYADSAAASHNLLFANATLQFSLPAEFRIEASWNYHSRLYSGNSEVAPLVICNLSIRKHLCRRRLTLHAGIYNIFDRATTYVTHPTAYDGSSMVRGGISSRHFRAGISYSFTSGKATAAHRMERNDEDTRRRLGDKKDDTITKNQ